MMTMPLKQNRNRVIRFINLKARTIPQIAKASGLSQPCVQRVLKDLRAEGRLYIAEWPIPHGASRPVKAYRYGQREDAPKPPTQTYEQRLEAGRRYRATHSDRKAQEIEAARRERIRQELARPAFRHWQDTALFGEARV